MLPTANFKPVRCTLLSMRAFDFDNNSCSFTAKKSNDECGSGSGGSGGVSCRVEFTKRQGHVSRAKDKQAWRALARAASTPRTQVCRTG